MKKFTVFELLLMLAAVLVKLLLLQRVVGEARQHLVEKAHFVFVLIEIRVELIAGACYVCCVALSRSSKVSDDSKYEPD